MSERTRVALFSEVNSKFGGPFFNDLLLHPDIDVVALVTSPEGKLCDYYVGEPDPMDLAARAAWLGVPVLRPEKVNAPEVVESIRHHRPDYLVIANYQQLFKEPLLAVPTAAVVNFHPSPLPRYAGLAPFFWMALAGERESGVTALLTGPGIDDGPVLSLNPLELTGTETAAQIRDLLFAASRAQLHEMIPRLVARDLHAVPQDLSRRSYFSRPTEHDRRIDWSQSMGQVMRTIRASSPQPGARLDTAGLILRIHQAEPIDDPGLAPGRPDPSPSTPSSVCGSHAPTDGSGSARSATKRSVRPKRARR